MLNKVNVATMRKGPGVGKMYDWQVGYNCKVAINSGKIRGAGSSTLTGEQQLEQLYCACAIETARRKGK